MGGGKKGKKSSKKSKPKTKAQKMATARKAAGKTISSVKAANKASMKAKAKAKHTASQAAKKTSPSKGGSISKGTTGIGPVKSGSTYSKAVSKATNAPTKKTSGIGPYADGAKYAAALKASPPKFTDGTKIASHDKPLFKSVPATGPAGDTPASKDFIDGMLQRNINPATPNDLFGIGKKLVSTDPTGLSIGEAQATGFTPNMPGLAQSLGIDSKTGLDSEGKGPSYLSIKSPESFGPPSQQAVDKAAGLTAGGLNIGGGGFTPSKPSGSTSRAVRDMTSEQLADRYDASLNPNSFKGLSDGMTFGVGPVASGDAYARGLNTDNKNVENRLRQIRNLGSTLTGGLIPSVRKLTDKEIADRRIKNAAFREANLVGRNKGGGARLPVAPLTPEEILLPEEIVQTGPDYQQIEGQTGLDPNRLMQIQQQAYLQAFNPSYNPMFRFFGRRGGSRRASFRKAFRRD